MSNNVKLIFKGITEIVGIDDLSMILLTDEDEQRQLAIVCDRHTQYQFLLRLHPVPVTPRLLPEALLRIATDINKDNYEVRILSVDDGQYNAVLTNRETLAMVPVRASDGILLSLITGMDILISRALLARQSSAYHPNSTGMQLPLNALSQSMLEKALEKAIADENYELASHLRDELNHRKSNERE